MTTRMRANPLHPSTHFIDNVSEPNNDFPFFACPLRSDILPHNTAAITETQEFLQKVVDVLVDFVKATNDRNVKVLEFHHPEEMKRLLDLDVPETALPLQQLVEDCATTLKYQVKTGKSQQLIVYYYY